MARYVVLLRGVNLGSHNRVSMPALRELLENAGLGDVRTYLQSGNVVLSSRGGRAQVAGTCREAIRDTLGLDLELVVRSAGELAEIVERSPLADGAANPKRYQVTFLERELPASTAERVRSAAAPPERVVVAGREIHAWHPDGIGRSKLASLLASRALGVVATSRNWATVTALLELAST